ncbi:Protoheme IX farnesyltransferase, mitochondrial [Boothiomyces macroporosus]|uniref:Protoheme IX farnesyltransferase, mitochondrial n=1 Tax=Boothiomyces macroporosus TaxID=261099 RepID=A0AAD5URR1_9FUNG|nr:Protoheme IX farnesyltransferase, mitochondrial [Boothiomyces macroporosus]
MKLSAFVLLTTMAGYALAPGVSTASTLLYTCLGTGLCISSANAINQWTEVPYDAQMSRTRNRVLVKQTVTPTHAFMFGTISGAIGSAILFYINPYCGMLGLGNIILYTCVYTPLKRVSIYNTWPGAVVGGIPPMIGWIACTGTFDVGAILLGLYLYAWQFPHFNALAWLLRPDYSKAGYKMMSVITPKLNAVVSLAHSVSLFPLSFAFYYYDIVSYWFLLDSSIINLYITWFSIVFMKSGDQSARKLFFASLIHLPIYLCLLLLHKQDEEEKY